MRATLSAGKDVVGKMLFEVFPDNPNHSAADGASNVRASLLKAASDSVVVGSGSVPTR